MAEERNLRMRDLVEATGLPRDTIHFYISEGLLPRPTKTGRNTALYGREHLERLQKIKELQQTQFLPLKAIKAVFDEAAQVGFTPDQEKLIQEVRSGFEGDDWVAAEGDVLVAELVPETVSRADLQAFQRIGLLTVRGRGAGAMVSRAEAELLGMWAEVRALSVDAPRPIEPDMVAIFERAMESLVHREARLLTDVFEGADPRGVSAFVVEVMPLLERFLVQLHRLKLRSFFEDFGDPPASE